MTQVSKRQLSFNLQKRLWEIFLSTLAQAKNSQEVQSLIDDLLSETEKVMLAKRLAIAVMLLKGYETGMIMDVLKVSSATVATVNKWLTYKGNGYRAASQRILKTERLINFWEELNDTLYKLGHTKRLFVQTKTAPVLRRQQARNLL